MSQRRPKEASLVVLELLVAASLLSSLGWAQDHRKGSIITKKNVWYLRQDPFQRNASRAWCQVYYFVEDLDIKKPLFKCPVALEMMPGASLNQFLLPPLITDTVPCAVLDRLSSVSLPIW